MIPPSCTIPDAAMPKMFFVRRIGGFFEFGIIKRQTPTRRKALGGYLHAWCATTEGSDR